MGDLSTPAERLKVLCAGKFEVVVLGDQRVRIHSALDSERAQRVITSACQILRVTPWLEDERHWTVGGAPSGVSEVLLVTQQNDAWRVRSDGSVLCVVCHARQDVRIEGSQRLVSGALAVLECDACGAVVG